MSGLKFTDQHHWKALEAHLRGPGERFAFVHTRSLGNIGGGPILEVTGTELIDDSDAVHDEAGSYLADRVLDRVHNAAIRDGHGLVEFHSHHLGPPRFSHIDEAGVAPMADYATSLMPDRAYGAGVYAQGRVHAEHWTRTRNETHRGRFRSVTVYGDQLRIVNAPEPAHSDRLDRQADLLGEWGSTTLSELRVAIVGVGGTGSHAALALAYLGVDELLLLDSDVVDTTNLNRLVTAGTADIGAPKNLVARRRVREIDPGLRCTALPALTPDGDHPELHDVDLIIGCVDEDGPRDRLNQIAVDSATPYLDIATGVQINASPPLMGGRAILVQPHGPCLHCHAELDPVEVARWTKAPDQQALDRQHGYGTGNPNPAVVHLNGITAHAAIGELIAWISGHRPPAHYLDIDLSGFLAQEKSTSGCRITPRRPSMHGSGCFACAYVIRQSS